MSKEIFDHDEGNAGLEKVHCLCMSHGMGTDSHACQEWAWRVWPGASTSAECIERRAGPAGRPARFEGRSFVVGVDAPRRTGPVEPAVRIAAEMGISAPDFPSLAQRRMAATPNEN